MNELILATADAGKVVDGVRNHKNRHFTVEYFLREVLGTNTPKSYVENMEHHKQQADAMMQIDDAVFSRAIRELHSSYTETNGVDYSSAQENAKEFLRKAWPILATIPFTGMPDVPLFDIPLPYMEKMVPGVSMDKSKAFFDWVKAGPGR